MSLVDDIKSNSRKIIIKRIVIFIIIFILWYFWYIYFFGETKVETKIETKISSVSKWDIKTFIEADGKALLKDELNLDFANEWIINQIFVSEGDNVKAWDKIADLDSDYLDLAVDRAQISLDLSKVNYEIKKRWVSDTEIDISQKQLDKDSISMDVTINEIDSSLEEANYNLELAKKSLENTKKQSEIDEIWAQNNLDNAKIDYENSISNLDLTTKQEIEKYKNTTNKLIMENWQLIANIEKYLYNLDVLLWISDSNKHLNDSYEIYLWAKNTSLKVSAENYYRETKSLFDEFYTSWQEYKNNTNFSEEINYDVISDYAYKLRDISSWVNKTLSYTVDVLKNSISSSNFPQTTIDSNISNFENYLQSSKNDLANYMILLQNVEETKSSMDFKIDSAEKAILTSSWKLNILVSSLEKVKLQNEINIDNSNEKINALILDIKNLELKKSNSIALSKSQVDISKASLDNKKYSDNLDLEPFYMAILQAQKSLDEAKKKKQDSILYSPIDWKIAKINWKIKENTSSLKDTFVTIINDNNFYVDAYVEEWDIVKVKNWQEVSIEFDAIDSLIFTGSVIYIEDKANIDTNWIVSYRVEILFSNTDSRIKDWMTATIQFITKEVKNVLIIPVQAVKNISWKPSVILENWEVRNVITWFTDWKNVEVISWLEKWEKVKY